jgi:predicted transport protein
MKSMNPKAPKILNDIVTALQTAGLTAVTEDTEGRVNSKKDEDRIVTWLKAQPKFKHRIREGMLRGFGDMMVVDDADIEHVVNIKTSVGSSDNAFSKLGLLWALTNLTLEQFQEMKIANKISDNKFAELVVKHKAQTDRDYWYLSLDKKDFSKVMVRGVKQINHWGKNPTNNLQIQWDKEHASDLIDRPFDEVFANIISDGAFRCWAMKADQWKVGINHYNAYLKAKAAKDKENK